MGYRANHYVNYQELTDLLKEWSQAHPDFCHLQSLYTFPSGREMWLVTITDPSTGTHDEKPAYWIDGNTHAGEVTGCQACIHTIHHFLTEKENNSDIKTLLKEKTFYILPRISVEGSEYYLTTPNSVRSTPIRWPFAIEEFDGFRSKDLDNNGHIAQMRFPSESGAFKASRKDPRVLLPRRPDDGADQGPFYNLLPEGEWANFDGFTQNSNGEFELDMNRMSPVHWRPEGQQWGAGMKPMHLPEAEALVKAIVDRPNIFGLQNYHTFSGVILRPPGNYPESDMDMKDLEVYKELGKRGKEITGYECISTYHDFAYDPKDQITGAFEEWAYEHLGIISFTTEIWNLALKAGIEIKNIMKFHQDPSEEENIKMLQWCDNHLEKGTYYLDWTPFEHPQLGPVEIGGWLYKYAIQNPPPSELEEEVHKNMLFTLSCAKAGPRLIEKSATVTAIGEDVHKIEIQLENTGFQGTYGSQRSLKTSAIKAPRGYLEFPDTIEIVEGRKVFDLKHLDGYSKLLPWKSGFFGLAANNSHEVKATWIVKGQGNVCVNINFHKAGKYKKTFEL